MFECTCISEVTTNMSSFTWNFLKGSSISTLPCAGVGLMSIGGFRSIVLSLFGWCSVCWCFYFFDYRRVNIDQRIIISNPPLVRRASPLTDDCLQNNSLICQSIWMKFGMWMHISDGWLSALKLMNSSYYLDQMLYSNVFLGWRSNKKSFFYFKNSSNWPIYPRRGLMHVEFSIVLN